MQLRSSHHWRKFRRLQIEGWRNAWERWRVWAMILRTQPFSTSALSQQAPVEVHILCCERDYLCALWTLKSFYHFAHVDFPLVIHLQGDISLRCVRRMESHFPNARIILQREADLIVERWLTERGLNRLLSVRRKNAMMLQLIDFLLIGESPNLLALDSDVLFFRRPSELLPSDLKPLAKTYFQHDIGSSYDISAEEARMEFQIELVGRLNNGIRLFARESLDLSRCEKYLDSTNLARKVQSGLIAQTLHSLYASEKEQASYLPDKYFISLQPCAQLSVLTARHYAGPSRHLLTSEGIPQLVQLGLLEANSN